MKRVVSTILSVATVGVLVSTISTSVWAQGRYLDAHGVPAGTLTAGSASAEQPFTPYSASYIPKHRGPLSRENDGELLRRMQNGFDDGKCDLVLPVIKQNAGLSSAHKFDRAVENTDGESPGLVEYYNGDGALGEQGRKVRELYDKIGEFNDQSEQLAQDIEDFENNRASMTAAERDAAMKTLRERADALDKMRADLVKLQTDLRSFVPSDSDLARILYFEDGLPRAWWDPNTLSRWRGYAPEAEGWEGFCHAWAPAGLDPVADLIVARDRIYANVPFGVGDLRELTSFMYPSPRSTFFGKRNYGENYDHERDDMTPVDVHTILTRYVGDGKPGVVFDVDAGVQVWNQPVYKYEYTATEVTGSDVPSDLTVPPGGKVLRVSMTATYGVEGSFGYRGDTIDNSLRLNYFITVDRDGNVVGNGKWDGYNRVPDFAWVPESGRMNKGFEKLREIATNGVPIDLIEEFCEKLAALPAGPATNTAQIKELQELLDEICLVLDQNQLDDYIQEIAEAKGYDYSELHAKLRCLQIPVG